MIYEREKLDDWSYCKHDCMWNPSMCDCDCNKACKIDEYLDIKICLFKKHLFGKLVLACEDEMLNITETLLHDQKVTCKKKKKFFFVFTQFH